MECCIAPLTTLWRRTLSVRCLLLYFFRSFFSKMKGGKNGLVLVGAVIRLLVVFSAFFLTGIVLLLPVVVIGLAVCLPKKKETRGMQWRAVWGIFLNSAYSALHLSGGCKGIRFTIKSSNKGFPFIFACYALTKSITGPNVVEAKHPSIGTQCGWVLFLFFFLSFFFVSEKWRLVDVRFQSPAAPPTATAAPYGPLGGKYICRGGFPGGVQVVTFGIKLRTYKGSARNMMDHIRKFSLLFGCGIFGDAREKVT